MIEVERTGVEEYKVTVRDTTVTVHEVRVTDEVYQKLAADSEPVEKLIERSFRFLLEREPNTAILNRFDLPVIGNYFPEYEREIRAGSEGGA